MDKLIDSYRRRIEYLRISVTDRCNLRCVYCMPAEGIRPMPHQEILTFEEILHVVRQSVRLGIRHVRITGGEPLVRKGIVGFIERLACVEGIEDVAMTTNAVLLAQFADALKQAGLQRVNISLDTLDAAKFAVITRGGEIETVHAGIAAALAADLSPVKLNCVVMRGVNDDEVGVFARLTRDRPLHVRFIEFMPIGSDQALWGEQFIAVDAIKRQVEATVGPLQPATVPGGGPARYWRLPEAVGTVGFISPVSEHFCAECNRLRLTADGKIRPCLLSDEEFDLKKRLRSGEPEPDITDILRAAAARKHKSHCLADAAVAAAFQRRMSQIGG